MKTLLGCTRDNSAEVMRFYLSFKTLAKRHKLAEVKAFLKFAADEKHLYTENLVRDLLPDSREGQVND